MQRLVNGVQSLSRSQSGYSAEKEWGRYLIYHIDKGLSVIPTERFDRVNLITIREDFRDQRDTLVCSTGTVKQASPCRNATVREKLIR